MFSGSKTGGTKAPAIHVHSMNYSHRSLIHAVATHVNYNITRQILTASWGEPDSAMYVASRAVCDMCDYVYEILRTV